MVDLSATNHDSQADAAAVAAVAQAVLAEQQLVSAAPPAPLPQGWVVKASQSQPDCCYYYNYETGFSTWQRPSEGDESAIEEEENDDDESLTQTDSFESTANKDVATAVSSKRSAPDESQAPDAALPPPAKRAKASVPKQVRVLHILKKHKDSRKPSSWRVPTITQTLEEATAEVQELLNVLLEVKDHPEELRATFEELARTESDCSSAKRGGDLGFFGPKKMQPAFEKASFALEIGELSGLVETSSGVHVILRIG